MAQNEEYTNLFGPSTADLQAALQQQQAANQLQISKLNPTQQTNYWAGVSGNNLGANLRELGAEAGIMKRDPRIQESMDLKQVINDVQKEGVNVSDPVNFFRTVAGKMQDRGYTEQAMNLSMKATMTDFMLQKKAAEVKKLDAEATAKLREKESDLATVHRNAREAFYRGNLEEAQSLLQKAEIMTQPDVTKVEVGAGTSKVGNQDVALVKEQLVDKSGKVVWEGSPKAKSTGVTVNNIPAVADERGYDFLKAFAIKQSGEFNKQFDAANQIRGPITDMVALIKDPKFTTGSMPELRNEVIRGLNTLGLATPEQINAMNNNDLFDAYARNVILPKMRMLGGSDSNEELRKVEQSYANRKMDLPAIRALTMAANRDIIRLDKINSAYNAGMAQGRNPLSFDWSTGSWRYIKGLPEFSTPDRNPNPAGFGATAPVTAAPTPPPEVSTGQTTAPAPINANNLERARRTIGATWDNVSEQMKAAIRAKNPQLTEEEIRRRYDGK